jgi:hypothetical protein
VREIAGPSEQANPCVSQALGCLDSWARHTGDVPQNLLFCRPFFNGANRDRTGDLLLAKTPLGRLSRG